MAECLDIERESYYRIERNWNAINVAELIKLTGVLGIEPQQLFSHPSDLSLDSIMKGPTPDKITLVADITKRVIGKS